MYRFDKIAEVTRRIRGEGYGWRELAIATRRAVEEIEAERRAGDDAPPPPPRPQMFVPGSPWVIDFLGLR